MSGRLKIFYAVQATGNGHIARALELMPYLEQHGDVSVFLSGNNSNLNATLPVKYRSKGVSLFYGNRGGLNYGKMWKELSFARIYKEAKQLPVEQYDVVINDFECITSLACRLKKVPSIGFGHQASFKSYNTPRPTKKELAGEFILQHYAPATKYVGLHFESYDNFIYSPIIKEAVLRANPVNKGHVTVYLSHYSDSVVQQHLQQIPDVRFEVFSKVRKQRETIGNITFLPINGDDFNTSMITCNGVITGAGFETPAEALYLGKKLLCLPIRGQYEQLCNAAALQRFNVPIIDKLSFNFADTVLQWLQAKEQPELQLQQSTYTIVQQVMELARQMQTSTNCNFDNWLTEDDFLVMG